MDNNIVGLDITENLFHLYQLDTDAKVIEQTLTAAEAMDFFANSPVSFIGMEAGKESRHWAETLNKQGHQVVLLTPHYLNSFIVDKKPSISKPHAIYQAITLLYPPNAMIKTQDIKRDLLDKPSVFVNHLKGLVGDGSQVINKHLNQFKKKLPSFLEEAEHALEKYNDSIKLNPTELAALSREFFVEQYEQMKTIVSDLEQERIRSAVLESQHSDFLQQMTVCKAESDKQQAELKALHAQIDPHFLNNTLAAIQALITTNPDNARIYIAKLASFFNETRESATLTSMTVEQELMQIHHYMEFQELRFKEKISFEIHVPTRLFEYQIPPRSLQTLVENALTHGKRGLTRPLSILISGEETTDSVILRVQDNGQGIEPQRLALLTQQIVKSEYGNGTALYYLQKSLALAFHQQVTLNIESVLEQGTIITIRFPKELVK